MNRNLKLRRIRTGNILISSRLPLSVQSSYLDQRYRVRGLAELPPEIIQEYILLHPPVVIRGDGSYHAIANLRSVMLSGYLHAKTKIQVLEDDSIKLGNLRAESAALEFLTASFGALDPDRFEDSILPLWHGYREHPNFPDEISSKSALAKFLNVNRRRLSKRVPEQTQPRFRSPE